MQRGILVRGNVLCCVKCTRKFIPPSNLQFAPAYHLRSSRVTRYNINTGDRTDMVDLPAAVHDHACAIYQNKVNTFLRTARSFYDSLWYLRTYILTYLRTYVQVIFQGTHPTLKPY